jgi:hypothetical protein
VETSERPTFGERFDEVSRRCIRQALAHGPVVAAAIGFWAYLATYMANRAYYLRLGVQLKDVGLGYEQLLSVGITVLFAGVALLVVVALLVAALAASGIAPGRVVDPLIEKDGLAPAGTRTNQLVCSLGALQVLTMIALVARGGAGFAAAASLAVLLVAARLATPPRAGSSPKVDGWFQQGLLRARQAIARAVRNYAVGALAFGVVVAATLPLMWLTNDAARAANDFRRCGVPPSGLVGYLVEDPTLVVVETNHAPPRPMWLLGTVDGIHHLHDRNDQVLRRVVATDASVTRRLPAVPEQASRSDPALKTPTSTPCKRKDILPND